MQPKMSRRVLSHFGYTAQAVGGCHVEHIGVVVVACYAKKNDGSSDMNFDLADHQPSQRYALVAISRVLRRQLMHRGDNRRITGYQPGLLPCHGPATLSSVHARRSDRTRREICTTLLLHQWQHETGERLHPLSGASLFPRACIQFVAFPTSITARRNAGFFGAALARAALDRPVSGHDNCCIGTNVAVGPSVTVGDGRLVVANSVVAHDIPPYTVVAGSRARVIGVQVLENPKLELV